MLLHKILSPWGYSISIVLLLLTGYSVSGQDLVLSRSFGGPGDNTVNKSVIDAGNNVYIIGQFSGMVNAGSIYTAYGTNLDIYVAKYNSSGLLLWFRQIGSTNADDYANGLALSTDGSTLYFTGGYNGAICDFGDGYTLSNIAPGTSDVFLVSLKSSDGGVNEVKRISWGSNIQRSQAMKYDKDGNLVVIGFMQGNGTKSYFSSVDSIICSGVQNYFILQLNSSLDVNWVRHVVGNDVNNKLFSIDVDNGGYYIAGSCKTSLTLDKVNFTNTSTDMFLYKINFAGHGLWVRTIRGSGSDISQYTTCDNKGHIYISGYYGSNDLKVDSTALLKSSKAISNKGSNDIFFAKYDTSGTLLWHDNAGSAGDDRLTRLATNGQYIVIAGQYAGNMTFGNINVTLPTGNGADAFGVVHDANDNPLYAITAGGTGTDLFQTCLIDGQGQLIFLGQGNSPEFRFSSTNSILNPTPSTRDVYLAKYDKASIEFLIDSINCHNGSDGAISANPKGAFYGNIATSWAKAGDPAFPPHAGEFTISSLTSGWYFCTMTDDLGYQKRDSVFLDNPSSVTISFNQVSGVSCYGLQNGRILISPGGGHMPYSFQWSSADGGGQAITAEDQTSLKAGHYEVRVTDKNGCTVQDDTVITQPSRLLIQVDDTVWVTSKGASNGAIYTTVLGGTPAYNITWTPGGYTAADITGLSGNNYTMTVTDSRACSEDTTIFIFEPGILSASYLKTDVSCYGASTGAIDLTISGDYPPFTTSWTRIELPVYSSTSQDISGLPAGHYNYTIRDSDPVSNSVITGSIFIAQPSSSLSLDGIATNGPCRGECNGSIDLSVTGGTLPYTYHWSRTGDGSFVRTTEDAISLCPGTYRVDVTDALGCTANRTWTITEPSTSLGLCDSAIFDVSCYGLKYDGSINVTACGGTTPYRFSWSTGLIETGVTTSGISNLRAASYRLILNDSRNCEHIRDFIISQPDPVVITATVTQPTCYIPSGTINVTNPRGPSIQYRISDDAHWTSNPVLSGLNPGAIYVVSTRDSLVNPLCISKAGFTINALPTAPSAPVVITASPVNSCPQTTVNLAALVTSSTPVGGSIHYKLVYDPEGPDVPDPTNADAGYYYIFYRNQYGCYSSGTLVRVTVNSCSKTLFLNSVLLQGLYAGGGIMNQAQDALGPRWDPGIADHITIELRNSANYSSIVYSVPDVELSTTGSATVSIPAGYDGMYYITIRHRNSLQTVSAFPISFAFTTISHSFGSPSAVFGGRLVGFPDGRFAIYGGDVNQDDIVDLGDSAPIDNKAAVASSGYQPEDVNGDGLVDLSDAAIIDNNAAMAIGAATP
jgi:hypothetical protein